MPMYEELGIPGPKRTVLVVEDNEGSREILNDLLSDEYEVIEAKDGAEGLAILRERFEDLSLIMLDVYMPVLDGFGFLEGRAADERYRAVPVMVTTASGLVEDEIRCLRLGANDVVVKPFNAEVLLNRAANIVRLRETASVMSQLRRDPLTGLYREEFFYRSCDAMLSTYPDKGFDVVLGDIANFRMLNERYGREACDKMLCDFASALTAYVPGVIVSGRVGDDSFALMIEPNPDLRPCLAKAVEAIGIPHLLVRFGIVEGVDARIGASSVCVRAEMAAREAQGGSGAAVAVYGDAMRARRERDRQLVSRMASGLENGEFLVYYQPKHDATTGEVAGAEALVRWNHPELGFVQPMTFVALFERSGLIAELDSFVRRETCHELARLRTLGVRPVPISVNVSPLDFDDPNLATEIVGVCDEVGVEHDLLHLELTETAYAEDPEDVVRALSELRSRGFKIELDDFGSGYSSLALLNVLPLDVLKIDASLVRGAQRTQDFRIIQSAIQIAHLLGLETVVEGVETLEALAHLAEMGCDVVQGYCYSKPLPRDEFEGYLIEAGLRGGERLALD